MKIRKFNEMNQWQTAIEDKTGLALQHRLHKDGLEIQNLLIDLKDLSDYPDQVEFTQKNIPPTILYNILKTGQTSNTNKPGFIFVLPIKNCMNDATHNNTGGIFGERECDLFEEIATFTRRVNEMGYRVRLKIRDAEYGNIHPEIRLAIEINI